MPGIDGLIRPHLVDVQTYGSMDPPEVLAQRAGIPADRIVKLNGNENPFGPSPRPSRPWRASLSTFTPTRCRGRCATRSASTPGSARST